MSDAKVSVTRHDPVTGQSLSIRFEEMEELSHADAVALLAYWQECRQTGGFSMLRNVPSKAIARFTKHLVVLEPFVDRADFRYRIAGMILLERLGRDVTGMTISEVFDPEPAQGLIAACRKVLDTDAPVFQRIHVRGMFAEVRRPELVMLPIGSIDGSQTWVLVGVFYHAN
ncbi:MAG: PAS domain-containing protein [Rhizomicrobium sp.]